MSKTVKGLRSKKRWSLLLVEISFLVTFIIIRLITHLQRAHILPNQNGVLHIHHMVPGIILLLFSGYISIAFWANEKIRLIVAILFGIGAALTIDEFALWLFLQDVYWAKQGRDSVDAAIIFLTVAGIGLLISEAHDHMWYRKILKRL